MTETDSKEILGAIAGINQRLDKVDSRLDRIELRLDTIDKDLSGLKDEVKVWSGRIFNLYNGAFVTLVLGIVLYIITRTIQL